MQNAFLVGDFGECGEILVNQIDSVGGTLGEFWGTDRSDLGVVLLCLACV